MWAVESIVLLWCYHEQQTQKSSRYQIRYPFHIP
nr:MAG TPA: hypothetical protein [Caudoviricetes sp.]